jgi:hypothetical protein
MLMKNLLTLTFVCLFVITGCKDKIPEPKTNFLDLSTPFPGKEIYPVNGIILNEEIIEEDGIICTQYTEGISATNTDFLPNNFEDKYAGQIFRSTSDIESSAWNPLLGGTRNGIDVTIIGPTVNGTPSYYMENPSLHEFNNILNEYKQQEVVINSDAKFSFKIIDVKSIEQLKFKLGADLKIGRWVDISSSIDKSEINEYSYFVIEMIQEHASVNISLPASPQDLYSELPAAEQLGEWSPLMLSSIKYGRAAYFIMKSSYSKSEIKKAIEGSFNFWKIDADYEISQEYENIFNSTEINAIIYGGAQLPALETIDGVDAIKNYLKSGFIDFNAFGVPLTYKFKYISDFSDAKIVSNLEYTYRDCEEITPLPLFTDHRICTAGSVPGNQLEKYINRGAGNTEKEVVTGWGGDSYKDNIRSMKLQTRVLHEDGTLGPRVFHYTSGANYNSHYELSWEADDGRVLVTMGAGVRQGDFRTLKIITARPQFNQATGRVELVDFEEEIVGSEPEASKVEAYCQPINSSKQQVVRGVGMRVYDSNLTTLKLWLSTLD